MAFAMFWEILRGIDLGFFIIRRRSGRGFEIQDEPAPGRRFAENAQHRDRPRHGVFLLLLCRGRACSINFSQRCQFHGVVSGKSICIDLRGIADRAVHCR
jgi:hypothetical protein